MRKILHHITSLKKFNGRDKNPVLEFPDTFEKNTRKYVGNWPLNMDIISHRKLCNGCGINQKDEQSMIKNRCAECHRKSNRTN